MSILSCIASTLNELRVNNCIFYMILKKKYSKQMSLIDISIVRQAILTLMKSFTKILKVYYNNQMANVNVKIMPTRRIATIVCIRHVIIKGDITQMT